MQSSLVRILAELRMKITKVTDSANKKNMLLYWRGSEFRKFVEDEAGVIMSGEHEDNYDAKEGKVDLVLPNHKLENTIKLTDHLQKLGIVEEKCKTLRIFPVSPAMWTSMCPPSCRRLSLR